MKQKFVLLDIDNTLFNSASYREKFFQTLFDFLKGEGVEEAERLCEDVYKVLRTEKGLFAPEEFVDALVVKAAISPTHKEKILEIIYSSQAMEGNLYDEVHDSLMELQKYAILGIFSQGSEKLQKLKLSPIMHFFHQDHMYVVTSKEKAIAKVFKKYRDDQIFLVDDALPVLYTLKHMYPNVCTIWMKRGRYANAQKPISGFVADNTVLQLDEAVEIIKEMN
jgi:FMN phosphatase YigB (HAD superfamily)